MGCQVCGGTVVVCVTRGGIIQIFAKMVCLSWG